MLSHTHALSHSQLYILRSHSASATFSLTHTHTHMPRVQIEIPIRTRGQQQQHKKKNEKKKKQQRNVAQTTTKAAKAKKEKNCEQAMRSCVRATECERGSTGSHRLRHESGIGTRESAAERERAGERERHDCQSCCQCCCAAYVTFFLCVFFSVLLCSLGWRVPRGQRGRRQRWRCSTVSVFRRRLLRCDLLL